MYSNPQLDNMSRTARQAVRRKDWTTVQSCARRLQREQRQNPEGFFLGGLADVAARRRDKALQAFQKALALDRQRYDAAVELAELYLAEQRMGDAAALVLQRTEAMRNSPLYLDKAASVLVKAGLPERAMPLFDRACELQPDADALRSRRAECLVFVGRIDEAKLEYRQLLNRSPAHQRNHYELSRLARATTASHVDEMKALLQRTGLPAERNVLLYYALGKELEDLERWQEAFHYYTCGGDAAAALGRYDVREDVQLIDAVVAQCTAEWLDDGQARRSASDAKRPIFVVGLPRSGTTLVERILGSHSDVESVGETFFVQSTLKAMGGAKAGAGLSAPAIKRAAAKNMRRLAQTYLEKVRYRFGDRPVFVDKLPENVVYLGFIAKAFPDATLILVNRNPMDVCFAMFKQSFFRYAYTLDDLGEYYVAYHRLAQHWRSVLQGRLIEVHYESLVGDQARQTRRLLDAANLEFEDNCLHFERNSAASNTASAVQIRQKMHTDSVGLWRHFDAQLQPLRSRLELAGIDTSGGATGGTR